MSITAAARRLAGVLVLGLALLAGACGGSDSGATGTSTPTVETSTGAPATTTAPPSTTAPATTTADEATRPGSATAGRQVFASICQGCHADLGRRAGYAPKLAGQGLTAAEIHRIVKNGRRQMPAGLVTGQRYEDVVAYVASIQ